jgi:hypothetical protein
MTLNATGPISLGGATTGQSVNLEVGNTATTQISFNDAKVRSLTGTSSGSQLVMPTQFYGTSYNYTVQYLAVAGGGGGGSADNYDTGGGGGGAGGYLSGTSGALTPGSSTISITVGGGGSGAYTKKTIPLSAPDWNKTISYSVGPGGNAGLIATPILGTCGTPTVVSSGTYTIPTPISGGGGLRGVFATGGGGGTTSGGDVGSLCGNAGSPNLSPTVGGPGGAARTSPSGSGGAGGPGGPSANDGTAGGSGFVYFSWS